MYMLILGDGIPTVFIAVAGRSNGLGPVLSGNAVWPVINCPPVSADWGAEDVWSSLRLPSGIMSLFIIYGAWCGYTKEILNLKR